MKFDFLYEEIYLNSKNDIVFNFNQKDIDKDSSISTQIGKSIGNKKFVYRERKPYGTDFKIYSIYQYFPSEQNTKTLKALKKKQIETQADYNQFLRRSSIYLNRFIRQHGGFDAIIIPSSGSSILKDWMNDFKKLNENILIIEDGFVKDVSNLKIGNELKKKIKDESFVNELEKYIDKIKKRDNIELKKLRKKYLKYIVNFFELSKESKEILDRLKNKSFKKLDFLIIDDIFSSGTTQRDLLYKIQDYGNPTGLVLFSKA